MGEMACRERRRVLGCEDWIVLCDGARRSLLVEYADLLPLSAAFSACEYVAKLAQVRRLWQVWGCEVRRVVRLMRRALMSC